MPLELDVSNVDDQISLDEFIEILDSQETAIGERSTLIKIAPFLKQLSNNRMFLMERICDDLVAEELRTFRKVICMDLRSLYFIPHRIISFVQISGDHCHGWSVR